jgi:hypothetical protein
MTLVTDKDMGCERCGALYNTEIVTLGEVMRARFCLRCTNDQMMWYDSLPEWRKIQLLRATQHTLVAMTSADGIGRVDAVMQCFDETVRLKAELATLTRAWIAQGVAE